MKAIRKSIPEFFNTNLKSNNFLETTSGRPNAVMRNSMQYIMKPKPLSNRQDTYIGIQSKLRKTNSLERKSNTNENINTSLSRSRVQTINRQGSIHHNMEETGGGEIRKLRKENSDLRAQLQALYKLDEQHKEIQLLLKQQFDFQQKYYNREIEEYKRQISNFQKVPNKSLQSFFASQTNELAVQLQSMKLPTNLSDRILSSISYWLENMFMQLVQRENIQKAQLIQNNQRVSDNDSIIDVGQLINYEDDSDALNSDSPTQSEQNLCQYKRNKTENVSNISPKLNHMNITGRPQQMYKNNMLQQSQLKMNEYLLDWQ